MFRKSILQLRQKDKLFFLLIAILAISGMFFGVRAGISYLSGSIKGHKQQLNATNNQVSQLESVYGPQVQETLEEIKKAGQGITQVTKELNNGLLKQITSKQFVVIFAACILGGAVILGLFILAGAALIKGHLNS